MKTIIILIAIVTLLSAETKHGFQILAGGRYDNVRMCVASDAGVEGGMMLDIAYMFEKKREGKNSIGAKIPIMRPILFGASFGMVQFEPEFFIKNYSSKKESLYWMPGFGLSVHYGPDYKTDKEAIDPEKFWALGPIFSSAFGVVIGDNSKREKSIAVRPFITPLFAKDGKSGVVAGGSLEFLMLF